jgi:hypothetical protein
MDLRKTANISLHEGGGGSKGHYVFYYRGEKETLPL